MHHDSNIPVATLNFYFASDASVQQRSTYLVAAIRQRTELNMNACASLCQASSSEQYTFLAKSRLYLLKSLPINQSQPIDYSHNTFLIADNLLTPINTEFSAIPGVLIAIKYEFYEVKNSPKALNFDVVITINSSEYRKLRISHGVQSGVQGYRLEHGRNYFRKRYPHALQAAGVLLSQLKLSPQQLCAAISHILPEFSLERDVIGDNRPWSVSKKMDTFYYLAKHNTDNRTRCDKHGVAFIHQGVAKFIFLDHTNDKPKRLDAEPKAPKLITGTAKVPKSLTVAELSEFLANTRYIYRKKITHEIVLSHVSRSAEFITEFTDDARHLRKGSLLITLDAPFDEKPTHELMNIGITCFETDYSIGEFELSLKAQRLRKMLRDYSAWRKSKVLKGALKRAA